MVSFQSFLWGEASTSRLPGINPAGSASHTGYQYDSISLVAGHRELAPPSKFSKLGGFNKTVFITSDIHHPQGLRVVLANPKFISFSACSDKPWLKSFRVCFTNPEIKILPRKISINFSR